MLIFCFGQTFPNFLTNNSATGGICNEKSLFVGPFKDHSITTETANGTETKIKKVGTLHLQLTDDNGVNHTYDVPGVVYDQLKRGVAIEAVDGQD